MLLFISFIILGHGVCNGATSDKTLFLKVSVNLEGETNGDKEVFASCFNRGLRGLPNVDLVKEGDTDQHLLMRVLQSTISLTTGEHIYVASVAVGEQYGKPFAAEIIKGSNLSDELTRWFSSL